MDVTITVDERIIRRVVALAYNGTLLETVADRKGCRKDLHVLELEVAAATNKDK